MLAVSSQQSAGVQVHICAWCGVTMQNGFPVEYSGTIADLDSHGICHGCTEKYFGIALASAGVEEAEVNFEISVGGLRNE
jgi:hypothetical protein